MQTRIDYIIDLVKDAGALIKAMIHENIEITTKANASDFVTNVDKAIEVFLVEGINKKYPNQDYLTEEKMTKRTLSDDLWIIDPIDGTTNFIFQRKNFAISIAYYKQLEPVFGIVYDVMADKLFLGIKGQGAFLNGVKLEKQDPLRPLKDSILYADLYSLTLFPKGIEHLRQSVVSHRYLGAASLEICAVCENQCQAYISKNLKVWDVAAGVIILEETRGSYYFGNQHNKIYFNDDDGVFVSAQNETIKHQILELMDLN